MTPFHVGMRVICVDDVFYNGDKHPQIIAGNIYTLSDVRPKAAVTFPKYPDAPLSLFLSGVSAVRSERSNVNIGPYGFASSRFRPAHENRMDELRTLLAPVPSKELVQS